jgi:uncharacterized protein (TIGR02001 family)
VAGNLAIASNELFRGDSLSDESPVLRGALSIDLPAGFFAGGSLSLAQREAGVRAIASSQYAGWAVRTGQVSIEAGAIHRHYTLIVDHDYRPDYVEVFAGVSGGKARLRLSVSPDYLRSGRVSYYGDAGIRLFRLRGVAFDGHAGLSLIPDGARANRLVPYVDASVDASRPLGPFTVTATLAWTNYPVFSASNGPRFAASIGKSF